MLDALCLGAVTVSSLHVPRALLTLGAILSGRWTFYVLDGQ